MKSLEQEPKMYHYLSRPYHLDQLDERINNHPRPKTLDCDFFCEQLKGMIGNDLNRSPRPLIVSDCANNWME